MRLFFSVIGSFIFIICLLLFSNFDIKYDERDNTYKVFEINLRQGRSNFYVTGAGYNLAKYITEDYIYNNEIIHFFSCSSLHFSIKLTNISF